MDYLDHFKLYDSDYYFGKEEYEFDLEDHPIKDTNYYRLHYINFHRIHTYNEKEQCKIGMMDFPYSTFSLKEGMSREKAFEILSYLLNQIEKKYEIDRSSMSVGMLDDMLESYGFLKVHEKIPRSQINDLFIVTGRIQLMKQCKYYNSYFQWNKEEKELKLIYKK